LSATLSPASHLNQWQVVLLNIRLKTLHLKRSSVKVRARTALLSRAPKRPAARATTSERRQRFTWKADGSHDSNRVARLWPAFFGVMRCKISVTPIRSRYQLVLHQARDLADDLFSIFRAWSPTPVLSCVRGERGLVGSRRSVPWAFLNSRSRSKVLTRLNPCAPIAAW